MIGMLKMVYEDSYLRMVYEDNYMDFYDQVNLPVYHLYSGDDVKLFYENNKAKITNEVFDGIKFMLREQLIEYPVFKLDIGGRMARILITRDKIDLLLEECIKNYEEVEDYERCASALELIHDNPGGDVKVK